MRKYIFFDIDGTLTNDNPGGIILPSTYRTLEKLKENGHFVAIATGRSYTLAKEALAESGIENAVCCGGNGLVIDNKVQYIHPLDKEKAFILIHECLEKDIPFGVIIDDSKKMYTHYTDILKVCPSFSDFADIHYMDNSHYEQFNEIHKIYIAIATNQKNPLTSLQKTNLHYARYHEDHIIVEPDDKYKGIVDMIKKINGSLDDVVVFGDGHNDISMMKQAPISIAMGNAIDELKNIADFVTKDCKHDGIEYACKHFHWI